MSLCFNQKMKVLCNRSSHCGWMSIQNERQEQETQQHLRKRGFDAFLSLRLMEPELTPSPPLPLSPGGWVYINPARLRQSSTTTLCGCT